MGSPSTYAKRYDYDRARGIYRGYMPLQDVRDHITNLHAAGFTTYAIARAAGIAQDTVAQIQDGRRKGGVWQSTFTALMGIGPHEVIASTPPNGYVPRVGATRRVRALQAMGWTVPQIATEGGFTQRQVWRLVDPRQGTKLLRMDFYTQLDHVYRDLHMTPGPSDRTRAMATRRGWAPPLAWDEESIDDPQAAPDFTPGPQDRRRSTWDIEDVEWLLEDHNYTWVGMASRLKTHRKTLERRLYRAGRTDLTARLSANTPDGLTRTA